MFILTIDTTHSQDQVVCGFDKFTNMNFFWFAVNEEDVVSHTILYSHYEMEPYSKSILKHNFVLLTAFTLVHLAVVLWLRILENL